MFLGTSIGILFCNLTFFLGYPVLGWRRVIFIIALPVFLVSMSLLYVPRSPRFLLLANRRDEMIAALRFLGGPNANFEVVNVTAQSESRGNPMHLFNKQHRFTTVLLMVIFFGVAFSQIGMLTIVVYFPSSHVCKRSEATQTHVIDCTDDSCCPVIGPTTFINSLLSSIGPVLFTIINIFVIDLIGRKKSKMLWAVLPAVTIQFLNFSQPLVTLRFLMAVSCGAIEALFSCAYVYVGEYYATSVRASAYGVVSIVARCGNMLGVLPAQVSNKFLTLHARNQC